MRTVLEKYISSNISFAVEEVLIGGKILYAIHEIIGGINGRVRNYDLNLYYSSLDDARAKLEEF